MINSLYDLFSNFKFDEYDYDENVYHNTIENVYLFAQSAYLQSREWFSETAALEKGILKENYQNILEVGKFHIYCIDVWDFSLIYSHILSVHQLYFHW